VNIICFFDPCFDEERMIQCARLAGMHEQIMAMTPLSYAIAQIPNRLHRFGNFVTKTGSVGCIVLVHSFFRQRGYSLTGPGFGWGLLFVHKNGPIQSVGC
jgi:hypothetical protein